MEAGLKFRDSLQGTMGDGVVGSNISELVLLVVDVDDELFNPAPLISFSFFNAKQVGVRRRCVFPLIFTDMCGKDLVSACQCNTTLIYANNFLEV